MRLRVRFTKLGKVRYTSHRDVARIWERAIRRVGLPVVYTEGFSPRPKVSFGLALPTGYESVGEYLDISVHPAANGQPGVFDGVGPSSGTLLEPAGLIEYAPMRGIMFRAAPEEIMTMSPRCACRMPGMSRRLRLNGPQ